MQITRAWLALPIPLAMFVIGVWIAATSRQIGDDMNDMRRNVPGPIGGQKPYAYGCAMAFFGVLLGLIGVAGLVQAIVAIAGGAP
jgi:hypothetical protein